MGQAEIKMRDNDNWNTKPEKEESRASFTFILALKKIIQPLLPLKQAFFSKKKKKYYPFFSNVLYITLFLHYIFLLLYAIFFN